MTSLLKEYGRRLERQHGWEVELVCPVCGHCGIPEYDGWTPTQIVRLGDRPTIFANVSCPNCGQDLKRTAGGKLVDLFSGVPTPARNKRLLWVFVSLIFGVPLLLFAGIWAGVQAGWWSSTAYTALAGMSLLLLPTMFWFNWQVHGIRHRCECGKPAYLFMGLLGRSYCYRCSSCGKLLRLRD